MWRIFYSLIKNKNTDIAILKLASIILHSEILKMCLPVTTLFIVTCERSFACL